MTLEKKLRIGISSVFIVCTILASYFNIFYPFDRILMDQVYQHPSTSNEKIKIIAIDEGTLSQLGTFGTWSRQVYADLIHQINKQAKTSIIAFDMTFESRIDEKGDQAFVNACKESGNIIIANSMIFKEKVEKNDLGGLLVDPYYVAGIENPFKELKETTTQGFSNALMDQDGKVRTSMLTVQYDEKNYDSFSYAITKKYCEANKIQLTLPLLDYYGRFGLNYTAKSGDYETVSFVDVLNGNVNIKTFDGCIVMIGAYSSGMQDSYHVPIQASKQMYGVEIHANLIESLMNQRTYSSISLGYSTLYVGIVITIFIAFIQKIKIIKGFISLIVLSLAHLALCLLLFKLKFEMPIITLLISMIVSYILCVVAEYIAQKIKTRKIENVFKKYVAPQVVDEIIKAGTYNIHLGGETRDIAVMFVDIRGFTSLSEILEATKVVEILNAYLTLTTQAIFENLGTLDKFVGDATMAVFNSPFDLDDYVYRAVATALQIAKGNHSINEMALKKYGVSIGFGVGVHCGNAVIGNVGSESRMDFTAIGDTVNTASRLESNAKASQVLVSKEVVERLEGRIVVNSIGKIVLKGKKKAMDVYEVVSLREG